MVRNTSCTTSSASSRLPRNPVCHHKSMLMIRFKCLGKRHFSPVLLIIRSKPEKVKRNQIPFHNSLEENQLYLIQQFKFQVAIAPHLREGQTFPNNSLIIKPPLRNRNCAIYRKGRFHSVSAGLTWMPALKANTLRIRSPYSSCAIRVKYEV